jgi:alkanesulfonate monooxygenase SsuD/methylene tetrahydromethanopterin reductase-like flavin-dependent oxidoreductase (luciferase family)
LSDHLTLDLGRYHGPAVPYGALEPLTALAALSATVRHARLGTLVLCEALRPVAVLAKALASLDRITDGRLDVGIGAGWHEPDYAAVGMTMPGPGERIERLREAVQLLTALFTGEVVHFEGRYHRAVDAQLDPPPVQSPRPPVIVGGKGDRVLRTALRHADGWNTCWVWTPEDYRERLVALQHLAESEGRDPDELQRSLGLYALVGEDEADLVRRFERLRALGPPGVLDRVTLDEWRVGRLVGTVDQVREQAAVWSALGVETLILGVGSVPFHVGALDDVELAAEALGAAGAGRR